MGRASWARGYAYCSATNKDGTPCGNKVATLPSGVAIYRMCSTHRRWAAANKRRQREIIRTYEETIEFAKRWERLK